MYPMKNNNYNYNNKAMNITISYKRQHCGFCKRNMEPMEIYSSHQVKDDQGRVTCPQLFKYRCELCGATGQDAHTRSYCPSATSWRQQYAKMDENKWAAEPFSSSSSSSNKSPPASQGRGLWSTNDGSSSSSSHNQQQPGTSCRIELGGGRMYRNMRGVTSTKYNSAGKLRSVKINPERR